MFFCIMLWENLKTIEKENGVMLKEEMEKYQKFLPIAQGRTALKSESTQKLVKFNMIQTKSQLL